MSAEEVAKAFVQHFYKTFDSNVEVLAGLYVSNFIGLFTRYEIMRDFFRSRGITL